MSTLIPEAELIYSDEPSDDDEKIIESRFKIMGINMMSDNGNNKAITLSDCFRKLAELLQEGTIKDFALTRTTMNEVFTDFAKF